MLSEIVTRLRAECPDLRLVEGLAALALLKGNPPDHHLPAGYVVPLDEVAGDNPLTGTVLQLVAMRWGVVLIVPARVVDTGATQAAGTLTDLRRAVRAALLGWAPAGAESGISFDSGELVAMPAGSIRWMDVFTTTTTYRSA